ncbi:DUF4326 domain-containing protein [Mycobacterium intracellulare]|uniref:DUF4326 domain-containing protein n=1 Tax=Mycobacterium intracellulare TaxID=1767 RepID=UPI0019284F78|nr:DUF4326 domain-containing protein [Mycobacterium intracellulare]MCA2275479.1 DUF4326 domain-containing protein [Mycobacterium intracellulare]MCA2324439.1 DUF4326 domain-containing protein [Mycobacterium intracellulare]
MPQRIQLRRTKGWRKPEGAIVVARPSRWGNPFRIYRGHHLIGPQWHVAHATWGHIHTDECIWAYVTSSSPIPIAEAVGQYRMLLQIRQRDEPERLAEWLKPLRGRDLACWCPLDQPCHADVLLEIANQEPSA